MTNIIKKSMLLLMACVACVSMWAQDPIIKKYTFSDHSFIRMMSDNGRWAVTESGSQDQACTPKLVDLTSGKDINIGSTLNNELTKDVTNDGAIVVGAMNSSGAMKPAYWSKADGLWHLLEVKTSQANCQIGTLTGGVAFAVSPDGKYAVGQITGPDAYSLAPALWDMTTGKVVATPGLPTKDMAHLDQKQMRFEGISADGRYILGEMSMSYLPGAGEGDSEAELGGMFTFVYDVQNKTYKAIGFTESETSRWKSDYDGCFCIDGATMSNNGRYVTGACRIWRATDAVTDYYVPYLYNVETGKFTVYEDESTRSNTATGVTNDGTPLMVAPEGSPYRDWYVFDGNKFWYSITDILSQRWGMDMLTEYNYENTGTIDAISDDATRILATPTYQDGDSYILDLPVPASQLINDEVSMLGSYTVSPAEESQITYLTHLKVTFTQNIETVAVGNVVKLEDENDNVLATATKNQASEKTLDITFRKSAKTKLAEGQTYYIHIPAGTIAMSEAKEKTNDDIYIKFIGRKDAPVACTKVAPSDGTAVAKVDVNTNPITLDFDCNVSIDANETRKAYIYRNEETEPYAELNFYYGKNQVALAPSTTVNLFKDNTYRVVVPAGIITDVAGNGANEEISFTYKGAYERTISFDDANLFKNDFDSRDITTAFMLYDGDQNVPAATPKSWNFNYSLPWYFVRSSTSTNDYAAASHSMYSPAGKSDDWMVVPQLYIPDAVCELQFESQGYLQGKDDYLKVYVWASDNVYSRLTKDVVERIKSEGDLVYNKLQDPGATEEGLEGEWTENSISLAKYAGKNIYIAFYNDNEDQSAVFINNVAVKHNIPLLVSLDNDESVVNKEDVKISGSIAANLDDQVVNDVTLTLVDNDGKTISTWSKSGLNMSKGKYTKFEFDNSLPLKQGVANKFKILMTVDGQNSEISKSINALVFQPVKRVVLEEFTGRDCVNCPLGIVTIESLNKRFGDKFLPIAIHGYSGDPLGTGLEGYYSYLKLSAAPSAVINRSDSILSPMISYDNQYFMSIAALEAATGLSSNDVLWSEYVEKEILTAAPAEVNATISYDEATRTFHVPASVRYAMNAEDQNLNLFAVLVEQDVPALYQQNNLGSVVSDILLPWSSGGEYSSAYVTGFNYEDVCRGVWGATFMGTSGLLPSNITAGEKYEVNDITFTLPTVTDINPKNCQAIVMLFDANTGKYVNAVRTARVDGSATGINNAVVDNDKYADNAWYTLSGLKMNSQPTAAGVYIHQGKKVVIK